MKKPMVRDTEDKESLMYRRPHVRMAIIIAVAVILLAQTLSAYAGTWPAGTHRVALSVTRLAGADRYETSVAAARAGWPGWAGVDRVIIASGEDRALADPLSAGSLCWAYDAPLLLVRHDSIPPVVKEALRQIRVANPLVDVTIVGGTGAVGLGVADAVASIVATDTVDRLAGADRYVTAADVALRSAEVARDTSRTVPARAPDGDRI